MCLYRNANKGFRIMANEVREIAEVEVNGKTYDVVFVGSGRVYPIKKDGTRGKELMPGGSAWFAAIEAAKS